MVKNSRYLSVIILNDIFNNGSYSNITLKKYLENSGLNVNDKGLVTEIVYGTLRYKLSIDNFIASLVRKVDDNDISTIILRSAIYQLEYLDKIPVYAILNESVELSKVLCKSKSKFINGVLRNYLRNRDNIRFDKNTLEHEYSFATWMINLLKKNYPNRYINLMDMLNRKIDTCYRVNHLKGSKKEIIHKFNEFDIEDLHNFKSAFRIRNLSNVTNTYLYTQGLLSIQDLSSQLACEIMEPCKNDIVIDLCASPGGKSCYIAELMGDEGKVISCDIHSHRVDLIKNSIKRLGLRSVECVLNDATLTNEKFLNIADKVILDVPCSGIGVINKKPEIKWFKNSSGLEEIINVQRRIIHISSSYIKRNGVLVYTTCTLNRDENENIIKEFLNEHREFKIEDIDENVFSGLDFEKKSGMITLFPSDLNSGFFINKLRRI